MDDSSSHRFFFIETIKREESVFNDLFNEINMQIQLKTKKASKSGGDAYDMILAELCTLLNYNPDELFLQDYNFVMKVLVSKAQNNSAKISGG